MRDDESYIASPTELVDSWQEPEAMIDRDRYQERDEPFVQTEGHVSPSKIVGSLGASGRLVRNRIKNILVCMIQNKYEVEHPVPPSLQRRNGRFYVNSDGHHRSMVAKAIGLDEVYATYETVPDDLLIAPSEK
jgi:hypothetical protein